jgi:hypothetical protein
VSGFEALVADLDVGHSDDLRYQVQPFSVTTPLFLATE